VATVLETYSNIHSMITDVQAGSTPMVFSCWSPAEPQT
jgi:hypothetical protein